MTKPAKRFFVALGVAMASYVVGGLIGSTLSIHSPVFVLAYLVFVVSAITALVNGVVVLGAWAKLRIKNS